MPRARTMARWLTTIATVLILVLYVLSVPFYSGSSIGAHLNWRFEHARLKVQWRPVGHHEGFYIDINNEGLRWAPDYHIHARNEWFFTIPLWAFLAATAAPAGFLWYRRRPHPPGHCKRCGYDRRGLAAGTACPECGSGKAARQG